MTYSLQVVCLWKNLSIGPIELMDTSISSSPELEFFYLDRNKFDGIISEHISKFVSLRELYLFQNSISGKNPKIHVKVSQPSCSRSFQQQVFFCFTSGRPGHSESQSDFGLVQSDFGFSSLSTSASFGLYENLVRDRYGFYRVRIEVSKSSKNRYNPMYFQVCIPISSSV